MEACPRLPMLRCELKRSPGNGSLSETLASCLVGKFGEQPSDFRAEIDKLESLRARVCVMPAVSMEGLEWARRYYCQLHLLRNRFGAESFAFEWYANANDKGSKQSGVVDFDYEMSAVLYNVGVLHALLGGEERRDDSDSMKRACTHFQHAAWAMHALPDLYPMVVESGVLDLAPDLLAFLSQLFLAQAQECILEKSLLDNRKPAIIVKVAAQLVVFYRAALNKIETSNKENEYEAIADSVGPKKSKLWQKYLELKIAFYNAVTHLYLGLQAEEESKMGHRLAYMEESAKNLGESASLCKNLSSDSELDKKHLELVLTFANDVISAKLDNARKENEFIYHDKVPEISNLPEPKGAALVKGLGFEVTDPNIAGEDIFARIVPLKAHEASSMYSEVKASFLRDIGSEIEACDSEVAFYMSSLNLEEIPSPDEHIALPQELIEAAASLSVKGDVVKNLNDAMARIASISSDVDGALNDINELIESEKEEIRTFEATFGKQGTMQLQPDLEAEAKKYRDAHKMASESNVTLHKAVKAHLESLKMMTQPLENLKQIIPSMADLDAESEANIAEVRRLLSKVEEMQTQRVYLMSSLREELHADDITSKILAQSTDGDNAPTKEFFAKEMDKYQPRLKVIRQNLAAQKNILTALTESNARYADTRQTIRELLEARDNRINSLISSAQAYDDLLMKAAKGLEFYDKLESNVSKLLKRVEDAVEKQRQKREAVIAKSVGPLPPSSAMSMGSMLPMIEPSAPQFAPSEASSPPQLQQPIQEQNKGRLTLKQVLEERKRNALNATQSIQVTSSPMSVTHTTTTAASSASSTIQAASSNATPSVSSVPPVSLKEMHAFPMEAPIFSSNQHGSPQHVNTSVTGGIHSANTFEDGKVGTNGTAMSTQTPFSSRAPQQKLPQPVQGSVSSTFSSQPQVSLQSFPNVSYAPISSAPQLRPQTQGYTGMQPVGYMHGINQRVSSPMPFVTASTALYEGQQHHSMLPTGSLTQSTKVEGSSAGLATSDTQIRAGMVSQVGQYVPQSMSNYTMLRGPHPQISGVQTTPYSTYAASAGPPLSQPYDYFRTQLPQGVVSNPQESSQSQQVSFPQMQPQLQPNGIPPSAVGLQNQQPLVANSQHQQFPHTFGQQYQPRTSGHSQPFTQLQQPQLQTQQFRPQLGLPPQPYSNHLQYTQGPHQLHQQQQPQVHRFQQTPQIRQPPQQVQPHQQADSNIHQNSLPQSQSGPNPTQIPNMQVQQHHLAQSPLQQTPHLPLQPQQQYPNVQSQHLVQPQQQPVAQIYQSPENYRGQHQQANPPQPTQQLQERAPQAQQQNLNSQQPHHQSFQPLPDQEQKFSQTTQAQTQKPQHQSNVLPEQQITNAKPQVPPSDRPSSAPISESQQTSTKATNKSDTPDAKLKGIAKGSTESVSSALSTRPPSGHRRQSSIDILVKELDATAMSNDKNLLKPEVVTQADLKELKQEREITKDFDRVERKNPYKIKANIDQLVQESKALDSTISSLMTDASALESLWQEVQTSTANYFKSKPKQSSAISVARCYPMKNRSPEVLPFDASRVTLPTTKDDYINASHIKELTRHAPKFIATQSPLKNSLADFWTMIWQEKVETVLCLVDDKAMENHLYFPVERKKTMDVGNKLDVTLQSVKNAGHVERIFTIQHRETSTSRVVVHLQLTQLNDDVTLLSVIKEALTYHRQQRHRRHPVVVHCLIGSGLTAKALIVAAAMAEINVGPAITEDSTVAAIIPDLFQLAVAVCRQRKGILKERTHLIEAWQGVLRHCTNVLDQHGAHFDAVSLGKVEKKEEKLTNLIETTDDSKDNSKLNETKNKLEKKQKTIEPFDPLSELDPFWSINKSK